VLTRAILLNLKGETIRLGIMPFPQKACFNLSPVIYHFISLFFFESVRSCKYQFYFIQFIVLFVCWFVVDNQEIIFATWNYFLFLYELYI